jgi:uncharacterized protein with HEPN domain
LPPSLTDRLNDILEAIDEIDSLVASISREEFANDRVRRLTVERLLEILSEASRHVPKTLQEASDIPWRDIADLGNLLRHAYHRVDADVVWHIAKNDLPVLRTAIQRLISESQS